MDKQKQQKYKPNKTTQPKTKILFAQKPNKGNKNVHKPTTTPSRH